MSEIYRLAVKPKSDNADQRRQEFIFNTLMLGLLMVAVFAATVSIVNSFSESIAQYKYTLLITVCFAIGVAILIGLSRTGKVKIAIYMFLALIAAVTLQMLLQWGYMLPTVLLLEALLIVIAGVLLSARKGLYFAGMIAIVNLLAGYLYQSGRLAPDISWTRQPYYLGDAIGFAGIFAIIGIVSWLSNREIDRSLKRARMSEKALAAERDSLEIKVKERTRQLEEAQLVRIMELQRFAEFGRLNANLLHEIANPLTAASLNLELLKKDKSDAVRQAQKNLKHLERYIAAARHQIRGSEDIISFSVRSEIEQLLAILRPRAKTQRITIRYVQKEDIVLRGNAVKFNQLVGNLLVNAVDSYAKADDSVTTKWVSITVVTDNPYVAIVVRDNGMGITKQNISKIFEPFYTTKTANQRSLGIGLVMVKQYVEHDYRGSVDVASNKPEGTVFTVRLRDVL